MLYQRAVPSPHASCDTRKSLASVIDIAKISIQEQPISPHRRCLPSQESMNTGCVSMKIHLPGHGLEVDHIAQLQEASPEFLCAFSLIPPDLEKLYPPVEYQIYGLELGLEEVEASGGSEDWHASCNLACNNVLKVRIKGLKQITLLGCDRLLLEAACVMEALEGGNPQYEFARCLRFRELLRKQKLACGEFGLRCSSGPGSRQWVLMSGPSHSPRCTYRALLMMRIASPHTFLLIARPFRSPNHCRVGCRGRSTDRGV